MLIAANKVVRIDYTLTDDQNQVIDTSQGGEPLAYLHGARNIIPGLENALEGKPVKLLRPRVLIYTAILTAIVAALVIAVLLRVPLKLDVLRDRNALFRETFDGLIENTYTLKVMNMDNGPHRYVLSARGIDGLQLRTDRPEITVSAGEVAEVPVRLQANRAGLTQRSTPVYFRLQAVDTDGLATEQTARFLGPVGKCRLLLLAEWRTNMYFPLPPGEG